MRPTRITRARFLHRASAAVAAVAVPGCITIPVTGTYTIILRGGLVCDGSGAEPFEADVGIARGKIQTVGKITGNSRASWEIDARGWIVAPGFIDVHTHSDYPLARDSLSRSKILQGVTTEVIGQDGFSIAPVSEQARGYFQNEHGWTDFAGYFAHLRRQGTAVNVRSMIGAGTLRQILARNDDRQLTDTEIKQAQEMIRSSTQQGARHLSAGLEYLPGGYADREELAMLAKAAGLYATHMRNEDNRVLDALKEAIEITRRANVPLHVSHIKAQGRPNWPKLPQMLALLDDARGPFFDQRQVTCDRYPYLAYSTRIENLFPTDARIGGYSAFLRRLLQPGETELLKPLVLEKVDSLGSFDDILIAECASAEFAFLNGRHLGEAARELHIDPYRLLLRIVRSGGGSMIGFGMSEENLERLMRYRYCAIASDGSSMNADGQGNVHPRSFGSFARVLRKYVREKRTITMGAAIRKMTSLPASIVGLAGRGLIREGYHADLACFNPETVRDNATYLEPRQYASGFEAVIVNGELIVRNGQPTGLRPGKIV